MKKKNPDPATEMRKRELDSANDSEARFLMDHHTASAYWLLTHRLRGIKCHADNPESTRVWVPDKDTPQTVCTLLVRWLEPLRDRLDPVFHKAPSIFGQTAQYLEQKYDEIERDLYSAFLEIHTLSSKLPHILRGWARVGKYMDALLEHAPSFLEWFDEMRKMIGFHHPSPHWASGDGFRKELAL